MSMYMMPEIIGNTKICLMLKSPNYMSFVDSKIFVLINAYELYVRASKVKQIKTPAGSVQIVKMSW